MSCLVDHARRELTVQTSAPARAGAPGVPAAVAAGYTPVEMITEPGPAVEENPL